MDKFGCCEFYGQGQRFSLAGLRITYSMKKDPTFAGSLSLCVYGLFSMRIIKTIHVTRSAAFVISPIAYKIGVNCVSRLFMN